MAGPFVGIRLRGFILISLVSLVLLTPSTNTDAPQHKNKNQDLCHLNGCEDTSLRNSSEVWISCRRHERNITGRCCTVTGKEEYIIGLDLSKCNLTDLTVLDDPEAARHGFIKQELHILVLEDNPLETCDSEAFNQMSNLSYLLLPSACSCPGGNGAWENTTRTKDSTRCSVERDLCKEETESCPAQSKCSMEAPGIAWCTCEHPYYGYKCLRKGTFPMAAFSGGIGGSTIGISLVLWLVLRRNVKKEL